MMDVIRRLRAITSSCREKTDLIRLSMKVCQGSPAVIKQSWCLFSLMIIGLLGAPGCGRPESGTGGTPQATSTKIESERRADQNAGIPAEQLGPILEAHYRGVGFIERFNYKEAVEAFREVHRRAPVWIPASINLAIALMYGGGPMPEVGGRAD